MMNCFLAGIQFSKDDSTQWVVLVVGVLATLYLVMRSRAKGNRKDPFDKKPVPFGVSQQRQIERDISSLMVEMLQTAQQMTAQLDTRATRLELLIKEADSKLAALRAATAGGGLPVAESQPAAAKEDPAASSQKFATIPEIAPAHIAPVETPPDPRHRDVYSLADQGRSAIEIARHLNRPNGEVELILALRPQ